MNYAQKARVLIHEATLCDGMEADALNKKHSTTSQAINIGEQCGVWRTVLTHFSPRYMKVCEIAEVHLQSKTLVAFDHMRIRLDQLEWAYEINHLYRNLISDD
jgi:ribonuclease Z